MNEESPWCNFESPLLIDLESMDVQYKLTSATDGVSFDFAGHGIPERVAWTSPASSVGFIVLDRNGNGTIDNGSELFGNRTRKRDGSLARHAFEALADLDDDNDGQISATDAVFPDLRLWIDRNHNGKSEADELSTMSEAGIQRLFTDHMELGRRDSHGNRYLYGGTASIIGKKGVEVRRRTYDVFFTTLRAQ